MPTTSTPVQSSRARWPASRSGAIWLGSFAVFAVLFGVGLWNAVLRPPETTAIPEELAGYNLVSSFEGSEALQMVTRLHQGSPELTEAWVAHYERGGTIWSGTVATRDEAREQVEAMARVIGKGRTPFSNLQEISLEGRPVFSVTDSNRTHYFFQSDADVIWIASPGGNGVTFVAAALRAL